MELSLIDSGPARRFREKDGNIRRDDDAADASSSMVFLSRVFSRRGFRRSRKGLFRIPPPRTPSLSWSLPYPSAVNRRSPKETPIGAPGDGSRRPALGLE